MAPKLSLTEQLLFTTVRLECELGTGETSVGTGFFFKFLDEGERHVPAIVTNKHVVEGATNGKFYLTRSKEDAEPSVGEYVPVELDRFEKRWLQHPSPEVDLCVMPIAPLLYEAQKKQFRPFYIPLDKSLIPSHEQVAALTAVEDVLMIGYPIGIWDQTNNMPVIRKGITATHPAYNYNGKKQFMIDIACFPGSSGSPVLIVNQGSYPVKNGGIAIGSRTLFLGILYAGPQYTVTGELEIVHLPTKTKPVVQSHVPINLGLVIKSEVLADFDRILIARG